MSVHGVKQAIKSVPLLGPALARVFGNSGQFTTSAQYWNDRYSRGGTSGAGSYNRLAAFKAQVLNSFVEEHQVASVIEFGCGDGAQLRLARYPSYVGVDVSSKIIEVCRNEFAPDRSKAFYEADQLPSETSAELSLSLDVIYHLVEDDVFATYMRQLFAGSTRFVIIYSSNMEKAWPAKHVRHRQFTSWIDVHEPEWRLNTKLQNAYPFDAANQDTTSFADFYFYEKR